MQGHVYILTNACIPGLVKIGMTTRTPEERAKEVSQGTGVPAPYLVAWSIAVTGCDEVERCVHARLVAHRSNRNREFFDVPLDTAIRTISEIAAPFQVPILETALMQKSGGCLSLMAGAIKLALWLILIIVMMGILAALSGLPEGASPSTSATQLPQNRTSVERSLDWYEGATIHAANMRIWRTATKREKLAAVAELLFKLREEDGVDRSVSKSHSHFRKAAESLVEQLDRVSADQFPDDYPIEKLVATIYHRAKQADAGP